MSLNAVGLKLTKGTNLGRKSNQCYGSSCAD